MCDAPFDPFTFLTLTLLKYTVTKNRKKVRKKFLLLVKMFILEYGINVCAYWGGGGGIAISGVAILPGNK